MNFAKKLYFTLRGVARHPLNRDKPLRSAMDFCIAQVAVRQIPGEACVEFPNDTRLLIPPLMKGAAHFITPGLCEFEEMCFVMHFLRPDDLFADVGANVGAYTVLASGVARARTVCFEPTPSTFGYLSKNIALNEIKNLARPVNAAVGKSKGQIRLTETLGTENYVCPPGEESGGIVVPLLRLDDELQSEPPTFIKVDVEGFETDVFAGGEATLRHPRLSALIVERSGIGQRYGYDERTLHEQIRAHGFVPCAYTPLQRDLRRIGNEDSGNIIYVRNFDETQKRLKEAEPVKFREFRI